MSSVVKSPKASPVMKKNLVEEKIIRYTSSGSTGDGATEEAFRFGASAGDIFSVRSGECVELIQMGVKAVDGLKSVTIKDDNETEWNTFYTAPYYGANSLPFYQAVDFEKRLMSWGYNSFDSRHVRNIVQGVMRGDRPRDDMKAANIAPTLKLPEGDKLKCYITAEPGSTIDEPVPIYFKVRRYKHGYPVAYSNFHEYDGGMASNKQYWEDFNILAATTDGKWVEAYQKQILKNEAFKFYSAGVLSAANLLEAKINIDDGRVEKDKYYVHPEYNQLPFGEQYQVDTSYDPGETAPVEQFASIATMHRFRPTIDIVKDNNEDITVSVRDNGSSASDVVVRLLGVRHVLA